MKNFRDLKTLLNQIYDTIESLTEIDELNNIVNGLNELVNYLNKLNKILINMPTQQEAIKAKNAIKKLKAIINTNPIITEILLGKKNKKKTTKKDDLLKEEVLTEIIKEKIDEYINKLSNFSENEMREYLENNKNFTNNLLRAILLELGRKTSQKTPKRELINYIVNTIINKRTYEGLRKIENT